MLTICQSTIHYCRLRTQKYLQKSLSSRKKWIHNQSTSFVIMKPSGCPGSKMQETLMVGRVMVQVPNEAVGWPASKMQETLMVGRVMVQVPNEAFRMACFKDAGNPNGWKSHGTSSNYSGRSPSSHCQYQIHDTCDYIAAADRAII
jgi:hypothetical protein